MKKSLIAMALLATALAASMAASAAPTNSASTATVFASSPDPNIQNTFCTFDGRCALRVYMIPTADLAAPRLAMSGGGSTCQKLHAASIKGLPTGGFVGGIYIPHAGVVPESNTYIAT